MDFTEVPADEFSAERASCYENSNGNLGWPNGSATRRVRMLLACRRFGPYALRVLPHLSIDAVGVDA